MMVIFYVFQLLIYIARIQMHPKYSALFSSVNLLLGAGPLILPMPFFNAGVLLSTIWMIIICFLSYQSAMFIAESMFILNQYSQNSQQQNEPIVIKQQETDRQYNQQMERKQKGEKVQLDHTSQFEILFGRNGGIFPCLAISVYLLGSSVSKCIMTGKIMSKVFSFIQDQRFLFVADFNFWIFVFFISGAAFSFRSIDNTKVMQIIIIGMRMISIILFLFGAIFLFCRDGIQDMTPSDGGIFNAQQFVQLFSNSVFSLMFHHSFPNIVSNLQNKEDVQFVVRNGLIISGLILIAVPMTGVMAFGEELSTGYQLKYYNFVFQSKINFIYWITSFYVFLNVAAFSIYIIVIRTNFLHIINPKIEAKKLSSILSYLEQTIAMSTIILACILLISWRLQDKIQTVFDFTGGVFGIVIIFLMPSVCVYKARILTEKQVSGKVNQWLPIFIGVLGVAFLVFNLYDIIVGLVNPSSSFPLIK